jgi:hypothetical protein
MKAVGLDSWPRFVADAQARARDPATVAAISDVIVATTPAPASNRVACDT